MTILRNRIAAALAVATVLTTPAGADDAPEPPDRYQVEVIVFRQLDQSRNTPEQPAVESITALSPHSYYDAAPATQPEAGDGVRFLLLDVAPKIPDYVPVDAERLNDSYARLQRLDAYAPILHRTWIQGARPAGESVAYPISARLPDGSVLTGGIMLFKERYLHLDVDLDLDFRRLAVTPDRARNAGDVAAPTYHLQESRRIRNSNAQYFDHPQFGVIAIVTRIDPDETASDQS